MLFVWISLWLIGILLLAVNPRSLSSRWLSGVAFTGGAGGLSAVLGDSLRPYAAAAYQNPAWDRLLELTQMVISLLCYYGLPYTFAMFALVYSERWTTSALKRNAYWLLALPAVAMLFWDPIWPIPYRIVIFWVTPYLFGGICLIAARVEYNRFLRRNQRLTQAAIIPPVLFTWAASYLLPCWGIFELWRYNVFLIAVATLVFIIALFTYGFLGVQILIERRKLDSTIRAITSGTAILNHAIKNDIGKMKLFGEKIKEHAAETDQQELVEDIQVVLNSAQHIQEMIMRVHDRTQDLVLRLTNNFIVEMIESTITSLKPMMARIAVFCDFENVQDLVVRCDRSQMKEVLHNVFINAIEAMPDGGRLEISIQKRKQQVIVQIKDDGEGIRKEHLSSVLEPFFSTKGNRSSHHNFGLGLAYSYQVMKKHGGSLRLHSRWGEGTTVQLTFHVGKTTKGEV